MCSHCCKPEELGLEGGETGWTPGHLESLQVCWVREATGATKNWQLLEPAPEVAFSEEGYPRALASAQAQFFPPKAAPASNLHRAYVPRPLGRQRTWLPGPLPKSKWLCRLPPPFPSPAPLTDSLLPP